MNLGQMILVLLAAICFSTLMISFYSGMSLQAEMAEKNVYQSQGLKIANHIFQTYETRLLAEEITFDELLAELSVPGGINLTPIHIEGITYYPKVSSLPTTIDGLTTAVPTGGTSHYQRIDVVIRVDLITKDYYVGNNDAPISKVFSS